MAQRNDVGQDTTILVGRRIREIRERKNLSQSAAAQRAGLSRNTLSLIERGQSSPTVSTLKQLAIALNVDINAFFDPSIHASVVYTKSSERPSLQLSECLLADLGAGLIEQFVTPLYLRLDPGAASGTPVAHDGQDFVFCLKGEVIFKVDDDNFVLSPGDSLLFDAHLEHRFKNSGSEEAELIIVLSSPQDGVLYINSHGLENL